MSGDADEPIFRALADGTRRRILDLLRARPRTTSELAEQFDASRFAVMKHLTILVAAGLVLAERRGRERINTLNPVPIQRLTRRWLHRFESHAADRLLDLEQHNAAPPKATRRASRA